MRVTNSLARLAIAAAGLALMNGVFPTPASAQFFNTSVSVVMNGLDNPRGLTFGPDGGLYVAEAGRGGDGVTIVGGDGASVSFGASGAVSRLLNGIQSRVLQGLPSLADQGPPNPGGGATGLHDIVFDGNGVAFGTIGLGGNQATRDLLTAGGAPGNTFGTLVQLNLDGSNTISQVADLTGFEEASNPDGGAIDSNPYGLFAMLGGGFATVDAGGNSLLTVDGGGVVTAVTSFAPKANPLPFGPPVYQSVPTSVAVGPDSAFYVGELTGFPFPVGEADVYRVATNPLNVSTLTAQFTNLIDITFGPDGNLYTLELAANSLLGGGSGILSQVNLLTGEKRVILNQGMIMPGGLTFGADGALYVSNLSVAAGGGQVIRVQFSLAPEPGAGALLALGVFAIPFVVRRRK